LKIKALSAEAKMSAIIIGALPIVVGGLVTVISPDYMTELYTTPTGHRNLMIGAGMMVLGTLMMRKMINSAYLVVALLVAATLYIIFSPLLEGNKLKKRMDSVSKARESLRANRMEELNQKAGLRSEKTWLISSALRNY